MPRPRDTENEGGVGSGLVALLVGASVALATVTLTDARGDVEPALELARRAGPTTEAPKVELDRLVGDASVRADGSATPAAAAHPVLPAALASLGDEILDSPMLHHPPFAAEVQRWVDLWSEGYAEWLPSYLGRMAWFEAHVDEELGARGLPWSLRYLPVIESGYSPSAVSSARAVGMWQFMAATARDFDIEVGPDIDDRRDPFASTSAAADYLLRLRVEFGSWFLALAAYNAGPDRINGLIERYLPDVEKSDAVYWALRNVLPKETADFVPNFLGAVIVASDPAAFGHSIPTLPPFAFDEVRVVGSVSFETVAAAAGTTADEIARLNPEYVRRRTPAGRQVALRLPPGRSDAFRAYFARADGAPGS